VIAGGGICKIAIIAMLLTLLAGDIDLSAVELGALFGVA
jgi:hypothetical protein